MEPLPNKPTADSSPAKAATANPSVVNGRVTASAPPMEDDARHISQLLDFVVELWWTKIWMYGIHNL